MAATVAFNPTGFASAPAAWAVSPSMDRPNIMASTASQPMVSTITASTWTSRVPVQPNWLRRPTNRPTAPPVDFGQPWWVVRVHPGLISLLSWPFDGLCIRPWRGRDEKGLPDAQLAMALLMCAAPRMSVSMGPGQLALTGMPGASSLAQLRTSPRTPCLDAT